MKIFYFFIIMLISLNSYSQVISTIDIDYIFKNSNQGKKILQKYQKKNQTLNDEVEQTNKKFLEKEKILLSKKNILSEEEFLKETNIFKDEIKDYNLKTKKIVDELRKNKEDEYSNFIKTINNVLIEYSKKNEIDILIDKKNILITKTQHDITEKILKILNE
jgi:outer membrane protein